MPCCRETSLQILDRYPGSRALPPIQVPPLFLHERNSTWNLNIGGANRLSPIFKYQGDQAKSDKKLKNPKVIGKEHRLWVDLVDISVFKGFSV